MIDTDYDRSDAIEHLVSVIKRNMEAELDERMVVISAQQRKSAREIRRFCWFALAADVPLVALCLHDVARGSDVMLNVAVALVGACVVGAVGMSLAMVGVRESSRPGRS